MEKWFSYDRNGNGLDFNKSQTEAKSVAETAMQEIAEEMGISVFDEDEEVAWGQIIVKGKPKIEDGWVVMTDIEE